MGRISVCSGLLAWGNSAILKTARVFSRFSSEKGISMDKRDWGMLLGGFAIGTLGIKALCSQPAKDLYVQAVAGGLRAKNSYDDIVEQARAQVDDIVSEAKYVNTKKDDQAE